MFVKSANNSKLLFSTLGIFSSTNVNYFRTYESNIRCKRPLLTGYVV